MQKKIGLNETRFHSNPTEHFPACISAATADIARVLPPEDSGELLSLGDAFPGIEGNPVEETQANVWKNFVSWITEELSIYGRYSGSKQKIRSAGRVYDELAGSKWNDHIAAGFQESLFRAGTEIEVQTRVAEAARKRADYWMDLSDRSPHDYSPLVISARRQSAAVAKRNEAEALAIVAAAQLIRAGSIPEAAGAAISAARDASAAFALAELLERDDSEESEALLCHPDDSKQSRAFAQKIALKFKELTGGRGKNSDQSERSDAGS